MLLVGSMFCFSYLLVPVYAVFCEITGLNGKTDRREAPARRNDKIDYAREVKVEFMSAVAADLPWDFQPRSSSVRIHPGQSGTMEYVAMNRSLTPGTGRAVPSIAPNHAARFFVKTECFCFSEQSLLAGERKELPLRFVVDPNLPAEVRIITLSYTFYPVAPDATKTGNKISGLSINEVSTVSKGTRG
jgi:cytochrome c oxidase assembly protein subunit 11